MVKITKVYTKTGDKGMTDLAGDRVSKSSIRIEAIGDIDELNAFLGLAAVSLTTHSFAIALAQKIRRIQNEIFDLGAQLAVLASFRRANTPKITEITIRTLENEIDEMNAELSTLHSFTLPGVNQPNAILHLARTVCRRAERKLVKLAETEMLNEFEIPFLNRLSDWLFVAARFVAMKSGQTEQLWCPMNTADA